MPTKTTAKTEKKPAVKEKAPKALKYIEEIGRRKTATARVRIYAGGKENLVNGKPFNEYFPKDLHRIVQAPLEVLELLGKFGFTAVVKGGGVTAQADAVRHGISKALVTHDIENRKILKGTGYLTRDPRMRERKKPGLKRARRAPQWAKR